MWTMPKIFHGNFLIYSEFSLSICRIDDGRIKLILIKKHVPTLRATIMYAHTQISTTGELSIAIRLFLLGMLASRSIIHHASCSIQTWKSRSTNTLATISFRWSRWGVYLNPSHLYNLPTISAVLMVQQCLSSLESFLQER